MKINLGSKAGKELLDAGNYNATIKKVLVKTTSKGDDMLSVCFETESEFGVAGSSVWSNYTLNDKCMWKFEELLNACNFDLADREVDFEPSMIENVEVIIDVTKDVSSYDGKERNNVKKVSCV